jgi:hypothetical protein
MGRLGEAVSWAAPGVPAPAWLDVAREYTEYWVHQQQVRDAVGRPGACSERLMAPVIDTFVRAVPYALRKLSPAPGTTVQIGVTRGITVETARERATIAGDQDLGSAVLTLVAIIR